MYQTIGESIAVAGVYKHGKFWPRKFEWQQQEWPVMQVTMVADTRDGGVKKRLYSVVARQQVCRLEFNRDNEQWQLSEIWVE